LGNHCFGLTSHCQATFPFRRGRWQCHGLLDRALHGSCPSWYFRLHGSLKTKNIAVTAGGSILRWQVKNLRNRIELEFLAAGQQSHLNIRKAFCARSRSVLPTKKSLPLAS